MKKVLLILAICFVFFSFNSSNSVSNNVLNSDPETCRIYANTHIAVYQIITGDYSEESAFIIWRFRYNGCMQGYKPPKPIITYDID